VSIPAFTAAGRRYFSTRIEAAFDGVLITSIYPPNGNPQPEPKFTSKFAWLEGGVDRCVRGEVNASDHAPVWIALDL
jgi:exonuclease III